MNKSLDSKNVTKVPSSRLSRLSAFGSLATRLAGNVIKEGVKQYSQGQTPKLQQLVLTPTNIGHVADKLAQLRGAAMKVGQMLSMDAGELLPEELSQVLAKLRNDANFMPHKQLISVLKSHWGNDWIDAFGQFELRPFAAASIGQVHLAYLATGEKLAVKIQYPGIRDSIDSDIDNVASLLKMSGLVPDNVKLDLLLNEAKRQLHHEADYIYEAKLLTQYQTWVSQDPHFVVPKVYSKLSNHSILCMEFVEGQTIESVANLSQEVRDELATNLLKLFLDELFTFKLVQTDPNFGNFLYQIDTNKIVLLDFGATRPISNNLSAGYKKLMQGAMSSDYNLMTQAAKQIGFFETDITEAQQKLIVDIFHQACEPLRCDGKYDFAGSQLAKRVTTAAKAMSTQQDKWHTPPMDAIFVHRKLAGIYLLAAKIKANVDVRALFSSHHLN
ncbi:ABC1 kinase family protein [Shewanella aestuarii]|uniref:AarF/ABC1/UbiB kinase family protein n=1 Tax=Shewanella aestuarii TaxID=1028752 RepID=A0A6G9QLG1_9GAMM|nr:AarF/ABC1/UbiB kinase family protein [Shewanella aestuarii]QIR15376.1 AarF/ABC1/UbiB kinase family protein [Shewanella aestuarii]